MTDKLIEWAQRPLPGHADVHLVELTEEHLPGVVALRRTLPDRLLRTEGSIGSPGHYDEDMLGRDATIAGMDPARHMLVAVRRDGDIVGFADVLTDHPETSEAWLGGVEVRADAQGGGLGTAIARSVSDWLATAGKRRLYAVVDTDDEVAACFLDRIGFRPAPDSPHPAREVRVMALPPGGDG